MNETIIMSQQSSSPSSGSLRNSKSRVWIQKNVDPRFRGSSLGVGIWKN